MLRDRQSLAAAAGIALALTLLTRPAASQIDGEQITPGGSCPPGAIAGQANAGDWDTIFECNSSSQWQRGPYFFGATSDTCDSNHAGMVEWTGSAFEGCNGSSWANFGIGGTGVNLGSSTAANPAIFGEATSGFYTTGNNIAAVEMNGVPVEQWNTLGSGTDYLNITPGKSGTAITLAATSTGGSDANPALTISTTGSGNITLQLVNGDFIAGSGNTASGTSSTAVGRGTSATGIESTAMGFSTQASGNWGTAMGATTWAAGSYSTAMGDSTDAFGVASTAMGNVATAKGTNSTAIGDTTVAASYDSVAMGRYNALASTNTNSWVSSDPLFEIGNGTGTGVNAADAVVVYKSGAVALGSTTSQAGYELTVNGGVYGTNASSSGYGGYFTNTSTGWALAATGTSTFNGDVGIGTITPSDALDVKGAIGLEGGPGTAPNFGIYMATSSALGVTEGGQTVLMATSGRGGPIVETSTNTIVDIGSAGGSGILNVAGAIDLASTTSSSPAIGIYSPASNQLSLTTSGIAALTITTTQSVGIGTATPAGILDVEGGTSTSGAGTNINIYAQNALTSGAYNGGSIILSPGAATPGNGSLRNGVVTVLENGSLGAWLGLDAAASGGSEWYVGSTDSANGIGGGYFVINNSYASGSAKFVINSSGNVGIGATSPQTALQVEGSSGGAQLDLLRLSNVGAGASTAAALGFSYGVTNVSPAFISSAYSASSGAELQFATGGGGLNANAEGNVNMTIDGNGNVGIGTTSPQATLDVNGFARLALNSSAPATCSSSNEGAIALTHLAQVCVCDTTPAWHVLNTGTACSW